MDYKIKIVVPVCRAFHDMNDFYTLNNKCLDFHNESVKGLLKIRFLEEYKNDILNNLFSLQNFIDHSFWYGNIKKHQYLEFSFDILQIDETKLKENEDLSEKDWKSLLLAHVIYSCEAEYKIFAFAFFLSFPVPTAFERGIILFNDKIYSYTDKYTNSFDCDGSINFQKCWGYLHDSSKFKYGYSQNNASRFVSVLSKMNEADEIIAQIFYATMALESVYARGMSEGISRQIINKSKIFLNIEIDEKKLRQLYDIRSRYIHGDTEIQLSFLNFDAVPGKTLDEVYELFLYANEILYKTAKKIIEENISTIDFDYNLCLS